MAAELSQASQVLVDVEAATAAAAEAGSTGQHAAAPAEHGDRQESLVSLPNPTTIPIINLTPITQSQIEAMLCSQGLSQQEPLFETQTQQGSLQLEMARIEEERILQRQQLRDQEVATALRGEIAQAEGGHTTAAVALDLDTPARADLQEAAGAAATTLALQNTTYDNSEGAAAVAAAAAAAAGPDQLQLLAQTAVDDEQEQQQQQQLLLQQQQQYADPQWAAAAAAYASMPMAAWAQPTLMPGAFWPPLAQPYMQQQQYCRHLSLTKLEHASSNAKRRGPMDEMRQLQRILTKLLPGSIMYMPNQDGGGNKVQADDIKVYLAATLGDAPKPDWGLKNGWGQYLADLFNWATGREGQEDQITRVQAMACARRPQGRSWEVVFDKLMELGVYSWNWELPLRHAQVLSCANTPPPELTRQQEALAAATAAAAAAAAVTAGAAPDAIPSLPVVACMASLLGKRPHQQVARLPPMSMPMSMSMAPPPMMFAPMSVDSAGGEAAASTAAAAAAAEGVSTEGDMHVDAPEGRAAKQQRSSSAGPSGPPRSGAGADAAAAAAAAAAVATATGDGSATAAPAAPGVVSDADMVVPSSEVLEAASMQQVLVYMDNSLSAVLQAVQRKLLSGAPSPPPDWYNALKNFKLDPLYASIIALTQNAVSQQVAWEQQLAEQLAQQPAASTQVKQELTASSQPMDAAEAAATAATAAAPAAGASTAAAAAGGAECSNPPVAASVKPIPVSATQGHASADVKRAAEKLRNSYKVAARLQEQDLQMFAGHQSATPAAAAAQQAHAAGVAQAAASEQTWQQAQPSASVGGSSSGGQAAAAARFHRAAARMRQLAAESVENSAEAAAAAALALTELAGSQDAGQDPASTLYLQAQQQQQLAGAQAAAAPGAQPAVQKRRVGGSRLANGSGRAARSSPLKAR